MYKRALLSGFALTVIIYFLNGCSSKPDPIRYKIHTEINSKNNEVISSTYLYVWDPGVWVGTEIYSNKRKTPIDSIPLIRKEEEKKAYEFFKVWMETEGIKDTVRINK